MPRALSMILLCLLATASLEATKLMVIEPPHAPLDLPVVFSAPADRGMSVELNARARDFLARPPRPRWTHGCGGMTFSRDLPARENQIADPVAALGAAYLKARAIRVKVLATNVAVANYPEGYFGDWVENGMMVRERHDISDETEMRALFMQLAENVMAGEDEAPDDIYWMTEAMPASVEDYREGMNFRSAWTIEFTGGAPLRLEYDPSERQLLLEAGDNWSSYALDPTRARLLEEMLNPSDLAQEVTE